MKRCLAWILVLASLCSLAACAAGTQNGTREPGTADSPDADGMLLAKPQLPQMVQRPNFEDYEAKDRTLDMEAYNAAYEAWQDDRTDRMALDDGWSDGMQSFFLTTSQQYLAGTDGDNRVYSPLSLYLALAMLAECTDGESRAQILSLLGLDDTELAQSAGNYIWRNLYGETSTGKTQLASSIWLKESVPYNEETLATLAQQYLASTFSAPMGEKKTDSAIAEWINENTGGLLRDAAGGIETKPETVMMLLSTLYFKDQWRDEFWEKETKKDTFTAADGAQQTVDFMHLTQDRADYCRGENFTVAQLSFRGGQTMRFLLPDEGTTLECLLADDTVVGGLMIYDMGVSLPSGKLVWSVPKFDVSSDLELTDALKALGVTDVFDFDKSDFSPLIDEEKFDESVAVMRVQHAARVKIDEKGCEAAAFTAVRADAQSAAPEDLPVVEMDLNRPFAFMITGVDGLPLFLGTVNNL